jgi:hypothetical protein
MYLQNPPLPNLELSKPWGCYVVMLFQFDVAWMHAISQEKHPPNYGRPGKMNSNLRNQGGKLFPLIPQKDSRGIHAPTRVALLPTIAES